MNDEMIDRIAKALRALQARTAKVKHEGHQLLWRQFKEQYPDEAQSCIDLAIEGILAIRLANYVIVQPQDIVPRKKVVHLTPQKEVQPTITRTPKVRKPMIIKRRLQEQHEKPTKG